MNIWKLTPFYRMYDFCRSWNDYRKAKKYVGETFYSEAFNKVIQKYLKVKLKKDWIGRLYGVVNPDINEQGNFDITTMIIEVDGNNTNNKEWVKNWIYKQMQLIAQLFKIEKMYDYISLEFKHIGPENLDNYLIIFDITTRKQFAKSRINLFYNLAIWGLIIGGALLIII